MSTPCCCNSLSTGAGGRQRVWPRAFRRLSALCGVRPPRQTVPREGKRADTSRKGGINNNNNSGMLNDPLGSSARPSSYTTQSSGQCSYSPLRPQAACNAVQKRTQKQRREPKRMAGWISAKCRRRHVYQSGRAGTRAAASWLPAGTACHQDQLPKQGSCTESQRLADKAPAVAAKEKNRWLGELR